MAEQLTTIANQDGIEDKDALETLDQETFYQQIAGVDGLDTLFDQSWEHYMDEDRAVSASEKVLEQVDDVQEMQFDPASGMITLSYRGWDRPMYVVGFDGGMVVKGDNPQEAALLSDGTTEQGIEKEVTDAIQTVVDRHWGITRHADNRLVGVDPDYEANTSYIDDHIVENDELIPEAQDLLADMQDDPYDAAAFLGDDVGVWQNDEYTMIGEIDEQHDTIDLYAADETGYKLDTDAIYNNLADDQGEDDARAMAETLTQQYDDFDLQNVAETMFDIGRGDLDDSVGWSLYNAGDEHNVLTRLQHEDHDRQTEAEIVGIGAYDIELSDQAQEKAEDEYHSGSKDNGFTSALRQVIENPDAQRLDFEQDGLTYKKGTGDTRLYGIENNDGDTVCVFETGDHDHMERHGLYDDSVAAKQVAQQAEYRIANTDGLDVDQYR